MSVLGHIHDWVMHKGGFLIFLFLKISADTECLNIVCLVNHLNALFSIKSVFISPAVLQKGNSRCQHQFLYGAYFLSFFLFFFFFLYHSTIK